MTIALADLFAGEGWPMDRSEVEEIGRVVHDTRGKLGVFYANLHMLATTDWKREDKAEMLEDMLETCREFQHTLTLLDTWAQGRGASPASTDMPPASDSEPEPEAGG